ncbi:MAG: decarboxylase [Novosphingobium lindaniclasticum]|uniref:type III PLP-dependent enzyme n=1 Tax=Novosphingobium lindaniclasticum TaxID=1329895 RepID=UPI00240987F0|nr:type III PLP-dependent enzyme [Novosphingobium lindaniclasticum]MDF2638761.1 decarboxylase [Novosphingobium lindaniclasticum]
MTRSDEDELLKRAADRFGTPCFVYFTQRIEQRISLLRTNFGPDLGLSYAVKANPNPALLEWLSGEVDHLDISSAGELRLAQEAGWDPALLSFTGPSKREAEIREAIRAGVGHLVIESLREARIADRIARQAARVQPVLVRISPESLPKGFGDQMAGKPTPFGIDMEVAHDAISIIQSLTGLSLAGFHIYAGTQCLKADVIAETYRHLLDIFARLCSAHDVKPAMLVMGSGLGVPYHQGETPVDLRFVSRMLNGELSTFRKEPRFTNAKIVLELGRYLVSQAGYFVTRVVSTKTSRGRRIAICDGGMNNHLPASGHFGMVMRRSYRMHSIGVRNGSADETEAVDVVGPLCTSIDRLASGVELPRLDEGDLIAVHNSGAYGLTASPVHFISHPMPEEVMVVADTLLRITRSFARGPARACDSEDAVRLVDGTHPAAANQNA